VCDALANTPVPADDEVVVDVVHVRLASIPQALVRLRLC
jgi:hypothetical protein